MKTTISWLIAGLALSLSGGANAALESRLGGQAVYDTDRNITWVADANLSNTISFGVTQYGGTMSWITAQEWISNLNASTYLDAKDWRLPTMFNTHATCTDDGPGLYRNSCVGNDYGGELGLLFYNELGGSNASDIGDVHNDNFTLFQNIQSYKYWTDTGALYGWCGNGFCDPYAWDFDFHMGHHGESFKGNYAYVWAVSDGDVAAIPEASTHTMFLAGLGLVGLMASSRKMN